MNAPLSTNALEAATGSHAAAEFHRQPLGRVPVTDRCSIFREFARERRAQPIDGFRAEALPYLSRYTAEQRGVEGFVIFADLPAGRETKLIDEQIEHFSRIGQAFEWKHYDFDRPSELPSLLACRGFVSNEVEAFMVLPLAGSRPPRVKLGDVCVRRIVDASGVSDIVAVQERVWGREFDWLYERLRRALDAGCGEISLYGAYADARLVGSGWTDFPAGSRFAELHGGAVLPEFRGRGIYSALFAARIDEARSRGYDYLCVDAAPMSRPILLDKGFQLVCETRPFHL